MIYNSTGYTTQEILTSFYNKILEIIDLVNENELTCEEAKNLLTEIKEELLPIEVKKILDEYVADGTLEKLINIDKLNTLKQEMIDYHNRIVLAYKMKGINVYQRGNAGFTRYLQDLDKMVELGMNTVFIPVYAVYDGNIITHELTITEVEYMITEAKNKGLKPYLKCHKGSGEITNKSQFLTQWSIFIDRYIDISKRFNIDTLFFMNELNTITNDSSVTNQLIEIIQKIKTSGLKCGYTYKGTPEVDNSLINGYLDIIGINYYPNISYKGYDISHSDATRKVYENIYNTINMITKEYKKPVIISEFGCTRNVDALTNTGDWNFTTDQQTYETQKILYKAGLEAFNNKELNIQGIVFWSTDNWSKVNTFSPFGNPEVEEIIKSYEVV